MKSIYKTVLLMTSLVWSSSIIAQTATAIGMHGDHLDLRAALAAFQESQTLDDFERKLNDPYERIHDLDLNGDNYIDYLAVIDQTDGYTHAITIRALLGDGESQDVAVIAVEKNGNNSADLQIIGDVNLYGNNYIIDPYGYDSGFATVSTFNVWMWPVIQLMFSPHYYCYRSPYHWQYYPVWWTTWHPVGYTVYYNHCHRWRSRYYYTNNCRVSRAHTVYVSNRCASPRSLSYNRDTRPSTNNNYGNNGGFSSNSGNGQITPSVVSRPSNTRQGNLPPQSAPSNQPKPSNRPSKFETPENPGYKPNPLVIGSEKPVAEKPRAQDPRTQKPMTEQPYYDRPSAEDPRPQKPSYEAPRAEDPRPQKPSYEAPRPENPRPLKPSFDVPRAEDPRPQKPSYETPRVEDPRPQKPSSEQPRPQAEPKPQSRPSYEAERPANTKPREERPSVVRERNDRPAPSRPSQGSGGSADRSRSGGSSKPSNSGSNGGGGGKSSPSKKK